MLPLELEGVHVREARERARAALVSVGIIEQLDRFPDDFSGGQQQRIAVARAVVGTRKLILADEPTGALDTLTGDAVIELIAGLPAGHGNGRRARHPRASLRVVGRPRRVHARRSHRRRVHGHFAGRARRRSSSVSTMRLPLRLARRDVWRRPGRTALVALLVAIPVAGMVLATVVIHTGSHTPAEEWAVDNGQADGVRSDFDAGGPPFDLPDGSRAVEVSGSYFRARTAEGRRSDIELSDLPLLDPLAAGIHDLVDGRAPTAAGEVALSRAVARRMHVGVGDDLTLERPAITFSVVGIVEPVGCLGCPAALVAPGTIPTAVVERYGVGSRTLIDLPVLSTQQLDELRQTSNVELRVDALTRNDGSSDHSVQWSLVIGAIALTVVGIVISAAFAVGARRQLVTLGQLSASGAPPSVVRAALVLQGTVTGLLGAVLGLGIAAAVLATCRGLFEGALDERIDHYAISLGNVLMAMFIGVGAATVAALLPARTAARIPTLAALAGRRPLAPVSRRLLAGGFAAVLGGLGLLGLAVVGSRSGGDGDLWAFVASVGGVAELLGACAIAPSIVARLEPLAHRLRGALRLGARSLARNRARTGAVVSAVAAAGALAVAAGALVLGGTTNDNEEPTLPDDVVVLAREAFDEVTGVTVDGGLPEGEPLADARDLLPGAEEITIRTTARGTDRPDTSLWTLSPDPALRVPDGGVSVDLGSFDPPRPLGVKDVGPIRMAAFEQAVVADDALLDAIHADAGLRTALDDTGIVLLTRFGNMSVLVTPPGATEPVAARLVHHRYGVGFRSQLLITPQVADILGLHTVPSGILFRTPEAISEAQRDGLEDLQYDNGFGDRTSYLSVQWAYRDSGPTPLQVELILSGIALRVLVVRGRGEPGPRGSGVEGRAGHLDHRRSATRRAGPFGGRPRLAARGHRRCHGRPGRLPAGGRLLVRKPRSARGRALPARLPWAHRADTGARRARHRVGRLLRQQCHRSAPPPGAGEHRHLRVSRSPDQRVGSGTARTCSMPSCCNVSSAAARCSRDRAV